MKRSPDIRKWIRSGLAVLGFVGVVVIGAGLATGAFTRGTGSKLVDMLPSAAAAPAARQHDPLPVEGTFPSLAGATGWLNSAPLSPASLRGKVVLVDFWTYSCINCLRAMPYVEAWYDKYKAHGLVVIGVHSPEFAFEKEKANVAEAVKRLGVTYPVALDNDYAIWHGFSNQFWPADYFIDAQGRIRHHYYGEGGYTEGEDMIRRLLADAGYKDLPGGYVKPDAKGAQAPALSDLLRSPETYVGYDRAENFMGGALAHDHAADYRAPAHLDINQWTLSGRWTVHAQAAVLEAAGGSVTYRFRGRDLHLVMGPGADGKPVRFRITLDGKPPGADHGMDTDAQGNGVVTAQRLYQLVRQAHGSGQRVFEITFLDPGVHVYSFTFG